MFAHIFAQTDLLLGRVRKSVMSIENFRPQFWGQKWLSQFYGRLAICGSFCWKTPMPIKFLLLGGVLGFLGGGVEVPILFLWARGFFRKREKSAFSAFSACAPGARNADGFILTGITCNGNIAKSSHPPFFSGFAKGFEKPLASFLSFLQGYLFIAIASRAKSYHQDIKQPRKVVFHMFSSVFTILFEIITFLIRIPFFM